MLYTMYSYVLYVPVLLLYSTPVFPHLSSHGSITVTRDVGANPEVQNVLDLTKQLFFSSSRI
jgi:hypothetical protein